MVTGYAPKEINGRKIESVPADINVKKCFIY